MSQLEVSTPQRTKEIIAKHRFSFKKSLGQNFLIDGNILNQIVSAADLSKEKGALEIGPGIGALTQPLAEQAGKVTAIEIDRRLIPILAEVFEDQDHVNVVQGDVLDINLRQLFEDQFSEFKKVSVVANLPYYVTTPILMKLLEEKLPLENIVVMIQKEVAQRMSAKPGGKEYGSLSVAVQYYCTTEIVCIVPNTAFIPQPNVDSAVIKLTVRDEPAVKVEDEAFFFRVVQSAFVQRRKTLINNLMMVTGKEKRPELTALLESIQIDPIRRGETLSLEEYATLSSALLAVDWYN